MAVEFHGGPKDGECIFIDEEVRIVNIPVLTGDRPIAAYHKVEQEVEVTMLSVPVDVTVVAMLVNGDMVMVGPPFVIEEKEIDEILQILKTTLSKIAEKV
jgi:23S rRNA A2030 N6-methylase RlmJ